MLEGCAQRSLSPNTNAATARVLDRLGISIEAAPEAGCCGATDYHLNAQEAGLARARRNIDAWWPKRKRARKQSSRPRAAAVRSSRNTAICCATMRSTRTRPVASARSRATWAKSSPDAPLDQLQIRADQRVAFHCPCTLQHAQKLGGSVEGVLGRLGFDLAPVPDAHLCCGSAGTYSFTQPELARKLRDNKLDALESGRPDVIATANIGCQTHLGAGGRTPVRHWIEIVDEAIAEAHTTGAE